MSNLKFIIGLLSGLLFITACDGPSRSSVGKTEVVNLLADTAGGENWGGDVRFSVIRTEARDASTIYTLQANYKGKPVGFAIELPKNTNKNNGGFGSGIKITSLGTPSDDFRNALAQIYKLKGDTSQKFVTKTDVAYVDLVGFSKSAAADATRDSPYQKELKFFFISDQGEEAELYFNLDKTGKLVELNEKDEEYRPTIIRLLTSPK
jgi:hypothetical protein